MAIEKKPKVSVILPVYNCEKYLHEAIESILDQTFKDFELLILDDGSTDKSSEIAKKYAKLDKRIRYFYHPNMGLTKTLNKGLKLARGIYIARQDADDISLPERLEEQVNFLDKNPEIVLVGSSMYSIDAKGKKRGFYKYPDSHKNLVKWLEKGKNPFPHTSIMFRKNIIINLGGYNELFKRAQDYDLYLRLILNCFKLASIPKPLVFVRIHDNSISRNKFFYETRMYALYALACYQNYKKHKINCYKIPFFEKFRKKYYTSSYCKYVKLWRKYQNSKNFFLLFPMFVLFVHNKIKLKRIYKWLIQEL